MSIKLLVILCSAMPTFVMAQSEAPRATGGPRSSGEAVTHGNSIGRKQMPTPLQ